MGVTGVLSQEVAEEESGKERGSVVSVPKIKRSSECFVDFDGHKIIGICFLGFSRV